jgi:hypothetical protein
MTRKWAGLGRERYDNLKVAVMSFALLAFVVAWVSFAANHDAPVAGTLVLAGAPAGSETPAVSSSTVPATTAPSATPTPVPTGTPSTQSDPPATSRVRGRISRGS